MRTQTIPGPCEDERILKSTLEHQVSYERASLTGGRCEPGCQEPRRSSFKSWRTVPVTLGPSRAVLQGRWD